MTQRPKRYMYVSPTVTNGGIQRARLRRGKNSQRPGSREANSLTEFSNTSPTAAMEADTNGVGRIFPAHVIRTDRALVPPDEKQM